ncbi:MAG: Uncharacterized protein CEN88_419 [Candidatus Berkelbacteria bacterium Licking1014_2]|uniref:HD domain-containing protein n=1 Tax=Candidatus Berkelbacteria bacterium Licking1014_2 TaxID=2017146 RepID=A0A554LSI9_9BACT|nr:MAG: Uncharacterized protein CEN88_419 [Candidatus Berkelbacteria bacterium Licking1014_2]
MSKNSNKRDISPILPAAASGATKPVGEKFGVILVIADGRPYEVATFRQDIGTADHRHPDKIKPSTPEEDASRRDFTINGIFYDPVVKKIYDFVGGRKDIKAEVIRFIGDGNKRISEDYLRMLRAIRFKNTLGFSYAEGAETAIKNYSRQITNISWERIRDELNLMFSDDSRLASLHDLDNLDLLKYILPELVELKKIDQPAKFESGQGDAFLHTMMVIKNLPNPDVERSALSVELIWAAILHDLGKPDTIDFKPDLRFGRRPTFYGHMAASARIAKKVCQRLRLTVEQTDKIAWLVACHMMVGDIIKMRPGKQVNWLRHDWLAELLELHRADASGKDKRINLYYYETVKKMREEELAKPEPPKPLVDGNDIMTAFHLPPSKEIGRLLEIAWDAQAAGES